MAVPQAAGAVPVLMLGVLIAFENTIGLLVVPATAGHVSVAVPLVEPYPVRTKAVVLRTPPLTALKSPIPGVVPPIVPGLGKDEVDPPRETEVPAMVIAEFARSAFGIELYAYPVSVKVQTVVATAQ